jgi:serine/threonine protein kinase
MDFVDGPNLRVWADTRKPLAPVVVAQIGAAISGALDTVHRAGVIHRDIKPENILMDTTAADSPKLTDFGIAQFTDGASTRTTIGSGTPQFIAPEIYLGQPATPAVDIYALGLVMYELLCGVPPYAGTSAAVMRGHLELQPARPPGVPDELWTLIDQMLCKNPQVRPSASQCRQALTGLLPGLAHHPAAPLLHAAPTPTPIGPSAPMPQAKQATKRNVLVLGGVAGIAVLAVIGLVFALWPSQQSTATSGHTSTAPTSAASSTASQSSAFDPLIPEGSAVAMYDFPGTDFLRGNTTEIGVVAQIANDPASYPNSIVTSEVRDQKLKLGQEFTALTMTVGMEAKKSPVANCSLQVFGDGGRVSNTGKVNTFIDQEFTAARGPIAYNIPLTGVYEMTVSVYCTTTDSRIVLGTPTFVR